MRILLTLLLLSISQSFLSQSEFIDGKERLREQMELILDTRTYDRDETIALCLETIPIAKRLEDYEALDEIYYTLSNMYFWINRDLSITYSKKGMELAKRESSSIDLGRYYVMLGKVAVSREQYDQGIHYYERADSMYTVSENYRDRGWVKGCLGNAYYLKKEYFKAIDHLEESIELEESIDSQHPSPLTLINLGNCFLETGQPDQAMEFYTMAQSIATTTKDEYALATAHLVLGKFNNRYGDYSKALENGFKSMELSRKSNNYQALQLAYEHLYETHKYLKNYQASLQYLELKQTIADSLEIQESDAAIKNLENSFALQKQASDLELMKVEKAKLWYQSKAQLAQNRLLFLLLISIGIVFLTFVVVFIITHKANKAKQKLTHETAEMRNRELTNLALYVKQRSLFIDVVRSDLKSIRDSRNETNRTKLISDLFIKVGQYGGVDNGDDQLKKSIELSSRDFSQRLKDKYPDLTDYESRLAQLLRMNLSSKEIAVLLDITPHSVNISRYRLRKKLKLNRDDSLTECFANL